jgi:hypothetical protein
MIGPGQYDKLCSLVRSRARATGAIVIVFGGEHGNGFSAQLPPSDVASIARVLREVADEVERDGVGAGGQRNDGTTS